MCKWHSKEKVNSSVQSAINKKYICVMVPLSLLYNFSERQCANTIIHLHQNKRLSWICQTMNCIMRYPICDVVTYCYLAYKIIINLHWKFKNWNEYTLIAVNLWNYHANHANRMCLQKKMFAVCNCKHKCKFPSTKLLWYQYLD